MIDSIRVRRPEALGKWVSRQYPVLILAVRGMWDADPATTERLIETMVAAERW